MTFSEPVYWDVDQKAYRGFEMMYQQSGSETVSRLPEYMGTGAIALLSYATDWLFALGKLNCGNL